MVDDTQRLDLGQRLSLHFTLGELIFTSHRTINNTPDFETIGRLTTLCHEFLEPLRRFTGPLWVTSGYRCRELNLLVRGSDTSAHVHGCAADVVPIWGVSVDDAVEWLAASSLPFDQAIAEHTSTSSWVHLGMVKPNGGEPRRQVLMMRNRKYYPFERDAA